MSPTKQRSPPAWRSSSRSALPRCWYTPCAARCRLERRCPTFSAGWWAAGSAANSSRTCRIHGSSAFSRCFCSMARRGICCDGMVLPRALRACDGHSLVVGCWRRNAAAFVHDALFRRGAAHGAGHQFALLSPDGGHLPPCAPKKRLSRPHRPAHSRPARHTLRACRRFSCHNARQQPLAQAIWAISPLRGGVDPAGKAGK